MAKKDKSHKKRDAEVQAADAAPVGEHSATPSTIDPTELATRLNSAAIHLLRRLQREDSRLGLSGARLSALSVLVFGGPRTLGQLADAEAVSPPSMTRLVNAMEAERPGQAREARHGRALDHHPCLAERRRDTRSWPSATSRGARRTARGIAGSDDRDAGPGSSHARGAASHRRSRPHQAIARRIVVAVGPSGLGVSRRTVAGGGTTGGLPHPGWTRRARRALLGDPPAHLRVIR